MLVSVDRRSFSAEVDQVQPCTYCGRMIFVLPNDRRGGSCFDCLSLVGPTDAPCPDCGREIPAQVRGIGCPNCGWGPNL